MLFHSFTQSWQTSENVNQLLSVTAGPGSGPSIRPASPTLYQGLTGLTVRGGINRLTGAAQVPAPGVACSMQPPPVPFVEKSNFDSSRFRPFIIVSFNGFAGLWIRYSPLAAWSALFVC